MNPEKMNILPEDELIRNQPESEVERFKGQDKVNGHEIICAWHGREYEIHFPQIEYPIAEEGEKKGVYDQNIRITDKREDAEFVYNKAKEWAEKEDDLYDLYIKVDELAKLL